ncbi:(deoxy)nucleoside triphosphate pyrophosphohydrolase [Acinetobacter sp. ANC 5579]|uniref:(deoxy)nucleoside triphosphate pyrophosphohydrolase n=1 Tax=Acinetobacter amyesii TaxID=2942470 RepID=UPI0020C0A9A6|nr:(deoxy)nucleoside triphosphate pyrophosphohydrolase [Acinetobacter amyesii]MCL6236405.1 (deoxy)nucleoside triphosphate pyrophosphohydrolase [Acinetobacter amyesii]
MKNIEVVAAIILNDEKILAVQKGKVKFDYVSYKWEFPGGKVEIDESLEQAITREILEELNIHVIPEQLLITVKHSYPDFHLVMHCFICNKIEGNLILNEHIQAVWLDIAELHHLDWAEADIPVIPEIKNYLLSKRSY